MAVQSDGKIVLAGSVADGAKYDLAVARFLPNGLPDTSFGSGGLATADVSGRSYSGHIIHVGPNETYTTIQAGYDAAQNGDTLLIDDGLYTFTSTFLVQKQITFAAVNVGGSGLMIGSLANLIALRLDGDRGIGWRFHAWSIPYLVVTAVLVALLILR